MKTLANLATYQQRSNQFLQQAISNLAITDKKLLEAMEYALLIGGKRMRPFLAYTTGEVFGANLEDIDAIAAAIECIHAYSLIHDDLPAMDDDDLRRGKPTCHIAFDEATAILAGDALQTLAFDLLANHPFKAVTSAEQVQLISMLAKASGYQGMCGGQAMDLSATNSRISLEQLEHIHALKTGALLKASMLMALKCTKVEASAYNTCERFAHLIGLAYQVQDDIIDVTSTDEELGKPAGSDVAANKSTYPALLGLQKSKEKADQLYSEALQALDSLPYNTQNLADFATFIVKRVS
ncbi:(2E,6E)-farnesyl diphosphate synthase [Thalassotalea agarivorans]|uniref:Farnesyl-diphosphate synthase n=1 Tax=Thalassotalea agarivorans TaxID=349064 RepID=A0A1I0AP90_THASX|nr:(2E,6E)-farnesyl diphosphate synthase [Thalassotalea agarivorans]SES95583.1 farnesyl-diphosphate synthase [Thalassotalea agarivorans]